MNYYPRWDTEGARMGGSPLPPSDATATPWPYPPEHERANLPMPPHCVPAAAPPVHCPGYGPHCNASTCYPSVQDQPECYDMPVPYINGMARSYSILDNAQQGSPFSPASGTATNSATPYMSPSPSHDTANVANGPMTYYQDNRITATSGRDPHGQFTTGAHASGGVNDYGPNLPGGANAYGAAGDALQTFAPSGEALAPSESLSTLTRRYVLDPGTRFETVNIGQNRHGRLKITIILEVADGV